MIAIKVLAIIGVIVGIYFFIEEQLDINLNPAKMEGKEGEAGNSGYLESVTGASLDEQLIEVLLMISSCLKAGRNLDQAFELVAVSTPPPICNEFRTLVQERRLGVPMVEALTNLANRVPSQDLRLAVNATIFQQETGGNLEDLYTQILLTISERKKIMGKIVAGTAHARLSGNLVATIPVILAIILLNMQPDYLKPMFTNPYGQIALLIAVAATIIGVVFINRMTTSILPDAEEAMISKNESNAKGKSKYKVLRLFLKPFSILMSLLPSNLTNKLKNETRFLLNASGKSEEFDVDEYIGLMLLSMVLFAVIMILFLNPISMGIWAWLVLILLLPIGFRLPRIYLAHLIRKRQKNIEFELPYVIDLLSLAIESGLDLTGGIAKVVEKSRNTDIIVEFKMFLADIKVGKSMEEALADMAERVKVLSFFSFVSSLIQAQRLGADIGPTLRAQAEQMRYQRLILAEERVNKLPVKLLIPLVFFVFPSISVLLIGPAMIQIQTKFPKPEQLESESASKAKKGNIGVLNKTPNQNTKVTQPVQKSSVPVNNTKISSSQTNNAVNSQKTVPVNNAQPKVTPTPAAVVVIEEKTKEKEHVVNTMPVVPSVTPAPIVITEPVAAPQVPAPVTIVEPVKESAEPEQAIPVKPANPEAIAVPTTITVPEKQVIQDNRIDSSAVNGSENTIPATNKPDSSNNFVPVESYIGQ
jgi:tight adherence protein C